MFPQLVEKYAAPVPRYTSYPTAAQFSPAIDAQAYDNWLSDLGKLGKAEPVSLYFHIPFCRSLCWYCGCTTKATQRHEPVRAYLSVLCEEMALVATAATRRLQVSQIHLGGGSPDILEPEDTAAFSQALHANFDVHEDCEIAIEVDPRWVDAARAAAFRNLGVTRVSIGVQDFCPEVQSAINRPQSFDDTHGAITMFRNAGVNSVNVDLVYGLPKQTRDSIEETAKRVLDLNPDRIALFGYAHLPSRIKHQRMIDTSTLPSPVERFAQANRAASVFTTAGYKRIGLDHFSRPEDALATEKIRRNFQGYTTDRCSALLGLGASAISELPQGYLQNERATAAYARAITDGRLATVRGYALLEDDRIRHAVIDDLMCQMRFSRVALRNKFGARANAIIEDANDLLEADTDGLLRPTPSGFEVTERGRPFIRSICACFDGHLEQSTTIHATGV